jgi:hypothetical protein
VVAGDAEGCKAFTQMCDEQISYNREIREMPGKIMSKPPDERGAEAVRLQPRMQQLQRYSAANEAAMKSLAAGGAVSDDCIKRCTARVNAIVERGHH